jgi:chorismate--pyruvate lyase
MVKGHFSDQLIWRQPLLGEVSEAPAKLRDWLLDSGSLTQRLQQASDGQLSVEVLSQSLQLPRLSERRALKLAPRQVALVREVLLFGRGVPWVFARSVIPMQTLTGRLRKLRRLDSSPLGALLFSDPTMSRGPLEWACIPADKSASLTPRLPTFDQPIWGRRSVFKLSAKPLLVCEMFLPSFKPEFHQARVSP